MLYLGIAAAIFLGDFFLKNWIEKNKKEGATQKILGGFLLICKHHNRGFVLNKASSRQPMVAALSLGLAVFCTAILLLTLGSRGNTLLRMGLALLLGGAYSNTYDRIRRKYVVDYFSFNVPMEGIRNIIFNLSDFCIMIGALLCVLAAPKQ